MVLHKFIDDEGNEIESYIDENFKKNLDEVKDSINNRGWDSIPICAGIPGVGKSTLAQMECKYVDSSFNTKDRICFTAQELVERTTNGKKGQAFMLDESFESLNTKVGRSSEFLKVMNHLQLVRQRGLFIVLCLPNFFDLSKGIAVFRSSFLVVVYHDNYKRGFFGAFGRSEKRQLYVKGNKFMDYNASKPNFRGRFVKKWIADEDLYEKLKYNHLLEQSKVKELHAISKDTISRNNLIRFMISEKYKVPKIAEVSDLSKKTIYNVLNKEEKDGI